jgi:anthranilate/para-aminobenzoate synthase component I
VSDALDPEPGLVWGSAAGAKWGHVPRWFGVLSYETERARLERPAWSRSDHRPAPLFQGRRWWRYGAVVVITHGQVAVVGDDAAAVRELGAQLSHDSPRRTPARPINHDGSVSLWRVNADEASVQEQAESHRALVERALERIREGDVYQINLARRLDFRAQGNALELLALMSETVRAPYAAAFELPDETSIVSTSPELFLQTDDSRQVLTAPIKGTRPRTGNPNVDALTTRELERDVKERAELAMVVDVERNDVSRIAAYGSVIAETPRVLPYSTVFHRVARVRGVARPDVTRRELFEALLPSGSVTGAPKIRAMELIAEFEAQRRGLYTGALGYIDHAGCVNLGMAIRCLVKRQAEAHYHVGGGIVIRSDPQRELEETFWKAEQVLRSSA